MNKEALKNLEAFTGTEGYHRISNHCLLTDGAKHLAENADCFWLMDIIDSYMLLTKRSEGLQDMQFWKLVPTPDGKCPEIKTVGGILLHKKLKGVPCAAVAICERDTDDAAIVQEIAVTDFPFDAVPQPKLFVQRGPVYRNEEYFTIMLPSEY